MASKYLREEGIYNVLIVAADKTKSKKGDDMLTVTFKEMNGEGREIRGYFVPKFKFMAEQLAKVKMVTGIPQIAKASDLLGKKLKIQVGLQKPTADGKVFSQVVDYFKEEEVVGVSEHVEAAAGDDIPF